MTDGNDIKGLRYIFHPRDIATAFALLTRLPVPTPPSDRPLRPLAAAAWAFPLVGVVVAVIGGVVAEGLQALSVAPPIIALCLVAGMSMVTGAMHEDGLADCADGFWGGWDRLRRLEIMKDSQVGTYGVLALIVTTALRWSVLTLLIEHDTLLAALVAGAVVSRAAMVWVMYSLPHARNEGLSHYAGRPGHIPLLWVGALSVLAALWAAGTGFPWPLVFGGLVTSAVILLARRKIGGQTGDVLGATQQLVELSVLITLQTLLS